MTSAKKRTGKNQSVCQEKTSFPILTTTLSIPSTPKCNNDTINPNAKYGRSNVFDLRFKYSIFPYFFGERQNPEHMKKRGNINELHSITNGLTEANS